MRAHWWVTWWTGAFSSIFNLQALRGCFRWHSLRGKKKLQPDEVWKVSKGETHQQYSRCCGEMLIKFHMNIILHCFHTLLFLNPVLYTTPCFTTGTAWILMLSIWGISVAWCTGTGKIPQCIYLNNRFYMGPGLFKITQNQCLYHCAKCSMSINRNASKNLLA